MAITSTLTGTNFKEKANCPFKDRLLKEESCSLPVTEFSPTSSKPDV